MVITAGSRSATWRETTCASPLVRGLLPTTYRSQALAWGAGQRIGSTALSAEASHMLRSCGAAAGGCARARTIGAVDAMRHRINYLFHHSMVGLRPRLT